jgi:hypothetical protein
VRQELAVDVRPVALSIEQYAEYLQSEAEELSLGVGLKTTTAGGTTTTALKVVSGADLPGAATTGATTGSSTKSSCKFWKTTE